MNSGDTSFIDVPNQPDDTSLFLAGGGEMGALIRQYDWQQTSLGVPTKWPQSLKTAIRIMLTSRQPIWVGWGPDLIFFYNDAYQSIVGGKHPWALGQPTSIVWQEIWRDIGPMLAKAMGGTEGTYVEEQLLIMVRNGYPEETYYTFSYSPIPNDDGTAGGIICANTDDTRRVVGERQLALLRELAANTMETRTSQQVYERSMEALAREPHDIPFAALYVADETRNSFTRLAACRVTPEHPAAPLIIKTDERGPWPLTRVLDSQQIEIVTDLDKTFDRHLPSGAWDIPPLAAALVPLGSSGSTSPLAILVIGLNPYRLFDDTYRGFLLLLAGQIEAAVGNALAYEQERQRAEALEEIDRAKTIFFSNVSHEFRTPLTLMLGPLEELLSRPATTTLSQVMPLIGITHRNGLRLLKLVNTLLDFSRIEAGRVEIRYQPTDIAAMTAELASTFRSAMNKAGLDFQVSCAPLPQAVYVDHDMWEKIVLNLLSNAFKFTFNGGVFIGVTATPDGSGAELTVRDTGTGIPRDELPKVFERFHRVIGARGRSIEGSGIGLALVQELVKLHGGTISVDSTFGSGTRFTVRLPFGTARADKAKAPISSTSPAAAPPSFRAHAYAEEALRWLPADQPDSVAGGDDLVVEPRLESGRGHVLIVDDNADLRDYMQRLLTGNGYQVTTAEDGAAALDKMERLRPDLILSDVMMPRLDGFGLLAAIRARQDLRDIPVLLLSARAGEEARVEGLQAGADDYLTKPFSARELVARVGSNLQLARLRRETEQKLQDEARVLDELNKVGMTVASELVLERAVQVVTDAATTLTRAAFGSFFYNVLDEKDGSYMLYTLSGVSREAFAKFPMPRNTAVFAPTFNGEGVVRSDDITQDPRYGKNAPRRGMPEGHLPVRSYLAVPVKSRSGEVLGGLFFGHHEPGKFTERDERIVVGIAAQAAAAIDNARLYQAAQTELAERRKAERALKDFNERLEQSIAEAISDRDRLWDLSDDLLVVSDYDGHFIRLSPSWSRVLGHDRAQLIAGSYYDLAHPDETADAHRLIASLGRGEPAQVRNRVRTADGRWRWIAWTLSPDPQKRIFHGVGRDVTADVEAAEALKRADETLRVAQKMEAIGKLTGGVAHDFNNLLQIIGGNLQLLGRTISGNEKAETRLQNALAGVARGSKLASQLLAFGRRQPLAPKVVNLGRLVRGLDDMLRRALGDGIDIETIISGGLWNTLVDPSQVENALLNLAINARDAMSGHGKLTIEAGNALLDADYAARHADIAAGQYVMLAVTDTGFGISPDIIEHVFEPFFTTKPEGQGTGLGLSMVYGFVKQSGGHVKIYSEPGLGTTIRLYLPRAHAQEEMTAEVDIGPISGGTETILVAEDDEDVRTTVVDLLSELGYRVIKAHDAQRALAIIESGARIDLLFTDVVMPGPLRSPELARQARVHLPDIAVLFTSGYTDNAIVHGGRLDSGIELLSKPYTREALARKVRQVLRGRKQDHK